MEAAAIIVSIVALAVSIFAVNYARLAAHAQRRLTEIEQARRDDEVGKQGRALLRARFVRGGSSQLLVVNEGLAAAHDVIMKVEASEGSIGDRPIIHGELPTEISAGGTIALVVMMHSHVASTCDVTFTWSDDAGSHTETQQVSTR
jgi:hypothetical protein